MNLSHLSSHIEFEFMEYLMQVRNMCEEAMKEFKAKHDEC